MPEEPKKEEKKEVVEDEHFYMKNKRPELFDKKPVTKDSKPGMGEQNVF